VAYLGFFSDYLMELFICGEVTLDFVLCFSSLRSYYYLIGCLKVLGFKLLYLDFLTVELFLTGKFWIWSSEYY